MTQTEKFLTGSRCSQGSSDLAVFESCSMWPKIRQSKIIPVGFYFVAGILAGRLKQKADLVPGIFIQGYRPHSSNGLFSSEKRGYGASYRLFAGETGKRRENGAGRPCPV